MATLFAKKMNLGIDEVLEMVNTEEGEALTHMIAGLSTAAPTTSTAAPTARCLSMQEDEVNDRQQ